MQWESNGFYNGNARQPPEELMHYGIKGQKWGIRRFQNEDRTLTVEGKERYNRSGSGNTGKIGKKEKSKEDREEAQRKENGKDRDKWKAKDVDNLSDDELRRRNNRLQAEQNYKNSMTPEWQKTAKQWGKEAVHAVVFAVLGVGIGVVTTVLKSKLPGHLKDQSQKVISDASKKKLSDLKG